LASGGKVELSIIYLGQIELWKRTRSGERNYSEWLTSWVAFSTPGNSSDRSRSEPDPDGCDRGVFGVWSRKEKPGGVWMTQARARCAVKKVAEKAGKKEGEKGKSLAKGGGRGKSECNVRLRRRSGTG